MTENRLREEICLYGRSLFERGLTPGSSGNISVRLDDGGWLVTPTNSSLGFLDPARISRLEPSGRLRSGDAPTKEIPLQAMANRIRVWRVLEGPSEVHRQLIARNRIRAGQIL